MILEINKKKKKIVKHSNMSSLIGQLERQSQLEFKKRFGYYKTSDMCMVEFCTNNANFVCDAHLLFRIKGSFTGDFADTSGYNGAKYCNEHMRGTYKRLRTPKKYWRKI